MGQPSPERAATPFPERIGRYELLLPIGTGGMATVFLARASGVGGFERDVALKIIHAHLRADEESKLHLLDEARLAARIRHPNVVPVLEVGDDPFGVYLVMDYVEGDSLGGVMRAVKAQNERMPFRLVARILSDTLGGLHAAHELTDDKGKSIGLVHRDYTPQNILIGIDGVSRLSDFSVAKAGDRAIRTRTGLVKGKIAYMSPEQARGHAVDRRCDVWAAGVVTWELIAWRRLHKQADAVSTLLSVVTETPPRLRDVVADVPPALDEVVARAMSVEVADRYATAMEFKRALDEAFMTVGGIADAGEVAEFAQRILGGKLQERRRRAAEVRKLRLQMEEIARPPIPESEGSPMTLAAGGRLADAAESEAVTIGTPNRRALGDEPETRIDLPHGQRLDSVAEPARHRTNRRRTALIGASAIVIAGAAAAAGWQMASANRAPVSQEPAPASAKPEPKATEPAAPLAAAHAAEHSAVPSKAQNSESEPTPEPTQPSASRPRAASTVTTRSSTPKADAAPRIAKPKSEAPSKLARDPYGGGT